MKSALNHDCNAKWSRSGGKNHHHQNHNTQKQNKDTVSFRTLPNAFVCHTKVHTD